MGMAATAPAAAEISEEMEEMETPMAAVEVAFLQKVEMQAMLTAVKMVKHPAVEAAELETMNTAELEDLAAASFSIKRKRAWNDGLQNFIQRRVD